MRLNSGRLNPRSLLVCMALGLAVLATLMLWPSRMPAQVDTASEPPVESLAGSQVESPVIPDVLDVADKHRIVSATGKDLTILLDLQPNREQLLAAGDAADALTLATARHYAEKSLLETKNSDKDSVTVYVVFLENMDEYNQATNKGMTMIGSVGFRRLEAEVVVENSELSFPAE